MQWSRCPGRSPGFFSGPGGPDADCHRLNFKRTGRDRGRPKGVPASQSLRLGHSHLLARLAVKLRVMAFSTL